MSSIFLWVPNSLVSHFSLLMHKMTSTPKNAVGDSHTFQLLRHPVFRAEVNRLANAKCRDAVKAGIFKYVPQRHHKAPSWYTPRMDLVDDPSSSNLSAVFEIPGVPLSGLSLQIHEGALVLRGERRPPYNFTPIQGGSSHSPIDASLPTASEIAHTENQTPKFGVKELYFGDFRRSIPLPAGIKQEDVTANLLNGMLTVTWPRSPGPTVTSIPSRTPGNITPPISMSTAGTAMQ
jgi:HSP20 family molecular chaperone IbpA